MPRLTRHEAATYAGQVPIVRKPPEGRPGSNRDADAGVYAREKRLEDRMLFKEQRYWSYEPPWSPQSPVAFYGTITDAADFVERLPAPGPNNFVLLVAIDDPCAPVFVQVGDTVSSWCILRRPDARASDWDVIESSDWQYPYFDPEKERQRLSAPDILKKFLHLGGLETD